MVKEHGRWLGALGQGQRWPCTGPSEPFWESTEHRQVPIAHSYQSSLPLRQPFSPLPWKNGTFLYTTGQQCKEKVWGQAWSRVVFTWKSWGIIHIPARFRCEILSLFMQSLLKSALQISSQRDLQHVPHQELVVHCPCLGERRDHPAAVPSCILKFPGNWLHIFHCSRI